WLSQHWTEKFALDLPDETEDWHHTPEEAAKVVVAEKQLLSDYLAASVALTKSYLDQIKEEQLSDVIDKNWTPPVTR
ncbi:DinB family glutathione transferase, partial [Enterococcus faecium]